MPTESSEAFEPDSPKSKPGCSTGKTPDEKSPSPPGEPYVQSCGFCHDGLVRLFFCCECFVVTAICDECELLWSDIEKIAADPCASTDDAFPRCPSCNATEAGWRRLTRDEILARGFGKFIAGIST